MRELLTKYLQTQPEIVFEWNDRESEAKGWLVINSLRGGAAGGGTRLRSGLTRDEVTLLSKVMEIKFTICGPAIGGAKSGIDFDPNDPRKTEVLRRWFKAIHPLLKFYYGTGGDLNVDEIKDVIPLTEENELLHPQSGIVRGHFSTSSVEYIDLIGQLRKGVAKVIEQEEFSPALDRKYTVADMITGYGVAEAVGHYYDIYGGTLKDKRVLLQGWGNVGAAAGFYLAQSGARIVGILDRDGAVINPDGFSFEEVRTMFLEREGTALRSEELIPFEKAQERFWDIGAEVFVPAAASRLVGQEHVERLIAGGLEVMSCGANAPFEGTDYLYGPLIEYADNSLAVIPDFIANSGMARVFAYLMEKNIWVRDRELFGNVSQTIRRALQEVRNANPEKTGLSKTALALSLAKLT